MNIIERTDTEALRERLLAAARAEIQRERREAELEQRQQISREFFARRERETLCDLVPVI